MNLKMARFALCSVAVVALGAMPASAQLSSAELFVNIDAGVSASDMNSPLVSDSFSDGPRTFDVFLASGNIPWDLQVESGGGEAETEGQIEYLATTTSQIFARGDFTMRAAAASPASALAGFDAVMSISFEVETQTTLSLTGFVSTGRELSNPEVVVCQFNGQVLAGDSRATPLAAGTFTFDVERGLFPEETAVIECSAASSGGQANSNTLAWEVTVNGLPEPETTLGTLVGVGALGALARRRR